MKIGIETLEGVGLVAALEAAARLRIDVFRSFPYLYEGSLAYEHDYLSKFSSAAGAILVVARDGDGIVGAATACPLEAEHEAFKAPLRDAGLDLSGIYYCAESVLLPQYRGQGIGHAFFDAREAKARALGFHRIAFCGVVRPYDHPLRPAGFRPLDPFWRKRGYAPVDGAVARFSWRDVGEADQTEKPLQFWMRDL